MPTAAMLSDLQFICAVNMLLTEREQVSPNDDGFGLLTLREEHARDAFYRAGQTPQAFVSALLRSRALDEMRREMEHDCEFGPDADRWPAAARIANNRRIEESRALLDRADAALRATA